MRIIAQFFALPSKRRPSDDADDVQLSMRTTANCRHNAAARLEARGRIAFVATTLLSLGLVFIPLMQNSGVDLALKDSVLNMIQIFLGVAVLVYSLIIGTARYEIRALQLSACADGIKDLIRELKLERARNNGSVPLQFLAQMQHRYSEVLTSCENHEPNDYRLAMLQMPNDYTIPYGTLALLRLKTLGCSMLPYLAPLAMLLCVVVMTAEMFALTDFTTHHLGSWRRPPVQAMEPHCPVEGPNNPLATTHQARRPGAKN